jgi:hypothetical protein
MVGNLNVVVKVVGALLLLGASSGAFAQNHGYITTMRSSSKSYLYVSQSVDGELGRWDLSGKRSITDSLTGAISRESGQWGQTWQGFGIGTHVGLELLKFVQFTAGHTFVNLRNKDDGLENVDGSRLNAGGKLVFSAPVGNLEVGGGLLASRLGYQNRIETGSLYGSGYYYSLGMNHFISSQVSFFGNVKMNTERLVRSGGSTGIGTIHTSMTLLGCGFSVWL